jgi:hypothetical protein
MEKVSTFLKNLFVGENYYKSLLSIAIILFLWIFYEYSQNGRYQFAPNNWTHIIDDFSDLAFKKRL